MCWVWGGHPIQPHMLKLFLSRYACHCPPKNKIVKFWARICKHDTCSKQSPASRYQRSMERFSATCVLFFFDWIFWGFQFFSARVHIPHSVHIHMQWWKSKNQKNIFFDWIDKLGLRQTKLGPPGLEGQRAAGEICFVFYSQQSNLTSSLERKKARIWRANTYVVFVNICFFLLTEK